MGQIVNKQKLAELQGVSLPTVTKWISAGMPIAQKGGRGKGYEFDNADVTDWRIAKEKEKTRTGGTTDSEAASKRRKLAAEANMLEMKEAEMRGELCVQADLIEDVQNDLAKVRARLLAIPVRAAPIVVGLDEHSARNFLVKVMHEALDELSTVPEDEFFSQFDPRSAIREVKFAGTCLHAAQFTVDLQYDFETRSEIAPSDHFITAPPWLD